MLLKSHESNSAKIGAAEPFQTRIFFDCFVTIVLSRQVCKTSPSYSTNLAQDTQLCPFFIVITKVKFVVLNLQCPMNSINRKCVQFIQRNIDSKSISRNCFSLNLFFNLAKSSTSDKIASLNWYICILIIVKN